MAMWSFSGGDQIVSVDELRAMVVDGEVRFFPLAGDSIRLDLGQESRGHSSAARQLASLPYVRRLIPANTPVLLIGDSESGAVEVTRQVKTWKWWYVLRQKVNHQVKLVKVTGSDLET